MGDKGPGSKGGGKKPKGGSKPVEKKPMPKRVTPPTEVLDPPERPKRKAKPAGPSLFEEPAE